MNKTARRSLPVALTLAAGITSATLIFATPTLATAEAGTSMRQQHTAQVAVHTTALAADNSVLVAKLARMNAVKSSAAATDSYATAGGPGSSQDLKINGEVGRITYKKISDRKLLIDGKDSGWIARYNVYVQRADGKVIYDKNLSVYRLVWFVNQFKPGKAYADDTAAVNALNDAASKGEIDARAVFKERVGSLGKFQLGSGKLWTPYDFSQHPGVKYIPLNYKG